MIFWEKAHQCLNTDEVTRIDGITLRKRVRLFKKITNVASGYKQIRTGRTSRKPVLWIRIGSGFNGVPGSVTGFAIQIRIRNPDPDPAGQKWPTNIEKVNKWIINESESGPTALSKTRIRIYKTVCLEELVYEEADTHNTRIVAEVDLRRFPLTPLHHQRQQRVTPVAQAHSWQLAACKYT
jgi:hypothetical protein